MNEDDVIPDPDEDQPKKKRGKAKSPVLNGKAPATVAEDDPQAAEAMAQADRYQARLAAEGWTRRGSAARGFDGYQEEINVAARHGKLTGAAMTVQRVAPLGMNGRPVEYRPVTTIPMTASEFYDHCMESYAVETDITIQWRINANASQSGDGGAYLCTGYLDLPPRAKQAPPKTSGDAGGAVHQPPSWQQAPAPPPYSNNPAFAGAPPGYPQSPPYGYPPPGYPLYGYPPPQPTPPTAPTPQAAPPIPPPPPGTPPETQAYIQALSNQLAQAHTDRKEMQDRLIDTAATRTPLTAEQIDLLIEQRVEARLRAQAPAPAPTVVAAPVKDEDPFERVLDTIARVDRAKTQLGYVKPEATAAPAAAPVAITQVMEDDSPIGMLDGGEHGLSIPFDKKTGDARIGTMILQNIPLFAAGAKELFNDITGKQVEADERQARLAKERDEARKQDALEVEAVRHRNKMAELAAERGAVAPAPAPVARPAPSGPRPWGKK